MAIDCHTLKVHDLMDCLHSGTLARSWASRGRQVLAACKCSPQRSRPLHRYLVPGVLGALLLRSWLHSEMNAMWTGSAVPPATLEDESHSELCSYQEPSSGYSPTSSTSASQVN